MRSLFAALRSLTLPFGGTGGRIELDGVTGEIRIYDTDGNLIIKLSPAGLQTYDTTGLIRYWLAQQPIFSQFFFYNDDPAETAPASVGSFGSAGGTRGRLDLDVNNYGYGGLGLSNFSEKDDDSYGALFQIHGNELDSSNRAYIDLTGAGITDDDVKPHTVVYDLMWGEPDTWGQKPTLGGSYGRGLVAYYDHFVADSARAAGINTVVQATFTVDQSRMYQVSLKSGMTVGTASAVYALELVENGTPGSSNGTSVERFRRIQAAEVPAGNVSPIVTSSVLYKPLFDGPVTLGVRNAPTSGGTITLTATAANEIQMWIEDIGARHP